MAESNAGGAARFALLVARFNSLVTEQLLTGTRERLMAAGVAEDGITVFHVPGAWELPQAARRIATTGRFDAIVAIGCVIRGDTSHFDFVAGNANEGLGHVALHCDVPIVFGVLTTDDAQQAMSRADVFGANRGGEFAEAALEMVEFGRRLAALDALAGSPAGR